MLNQKRHPKRRRKRRSQKKIQSEVNWLWKTELKLRMAHFIDCDTITRWRIGEELSMCRVMRNHLVAVLTGCYESSWMACACIVNIMCSQWSLCNVATADAFCARTKERRQADWDLNRIEWCKLPVRRVYTSVVSPSRDSVPWKVKILLLWHPAGILDQLMHIGAACVTMIFCIIVASHQNLDRNVEMGRVMGRLYL